MLLFIILFQHGIEVSPMDSDVYENAKDILKHDGKLEAFAELNRLTVETAKQLLERFMKQPEIAKEFNDYIFSSERSDDFKGYTAGEEKGFQRGHEAGFAKGAIMGVMGTLTLAGLVILSSRR